MTPDDPHLPIWESQYPERDTYLIQQALFMAVHFIDGLPKEMRSLSDHDDMLDMLREHLGERYTGAAQRMAAMLLEMTGRSFDFTASKDDDMDDAA